MVNRFYCVCKVVFPLWFGERKKIRKNKQTKPTKKANGKIKTPNPLLKLQITSIFPESICSMNKSKAAKKAPFCEPIGCSKQVRQIQVPAAVLYHLNVAHNTLNLDINHVWLWNYSNQARLSHMCRTDQSHSKNSVSVPICAWMSAVISRANA